LLKQETCRSVEHGICPMLDMSSVFSHKISRSCKRAWKDILVSKLTQIAHCARYC